MYLIIKHLICGGQTVLNVKWCSLSYPTPAQLQQNVHIITVFKEAMETDNEFVVYSPVNVDFLCHL